MSMSKLSLTCFSALFAMIALVPGTSSALDRTTSITPASGLCQITDSVYATSFKTKALSSDNIGSGTIYVTCGISGTKELGLPSFKIALRNQGATQTANISCTAVTGTTSTPATYYSKTISLAAGTEGQIEWTASGDAGAYSFPTPLSITCAMPSQTGIMNVELITMTPIA